MQEEQEKSKIVTEEKESTNADPEEYSL